MSLSCSSCNTGRTSLRNRMQSRSLSNLIHVNFTNNCNMLRITIRLRMYKIILNLNSSRSLFSNSGYRWQIYSLNMLNKNANHMNSSSLKNMRIKSWRWPKLKNQNRLWNLNNSNYRLLERCNLIDMQNWLWLNVISLYLVKTFLVVGMIQKFHFNNYFLANQSINKIHIK